MNADLPNLTSINSEGDSFCNPRSVSLESTSKLYYCELIDIPSIQSVNLPVVSSAISFSKVDIATISSF